MKMDNFISDIPEIFRSNKNGELLASCIMCDDDLLNYEHGYVIEKAFNKKPGTDDFELIFEYAICTECQQSLSKEMSEKSMKNIRRFFNVHKTNISGLSNTDSDISKRLRTCMISDNEVADMKEYQIAGQFYKDHMIVFDAFPFAIGDHAIDEIQELLSKKTKDFSDKFKDLILPPDVRDKIPDDRLVFF
jgi:hypothetical protein